MNYLTRYSGIPFRKYIVITMCLIASLLLFTNHYFHPDKKSFTLISGEKDTSGTDQIKPALENEELQIKNKAEELKQWLKDTSHASFSLQYKNASYTCFIFDLTDTLNDIRFHLKSEQNKNYTSISNLYKSLSADKSHDVLMITNGGMYLTDLSPQGLFIEQGKKIKSLDTISNSNNTNFYMFPNGVFAIDSNQTPYVLRTNEYTGTIQEKTVKSATQSGPMLVINGAIHPRFIKGSSNLNIRNGVGIPFEDTSRLLFILSDEEVNFYDFASVFKDLFGCKNALYLDGAISLMYAKDIHKNKVPGGHLGPLISVTRKK